MSLNGKVALATGSTSGIREALAAEGTAVMLNGFGDAAAVEKLRAISQ
jgi:3-hydroxybutyrate dehydrogenase